MTLSPQQVLETVLFLVYQLLMATKENYQQNVSSFEIAKIEITSNTTKKKKKTIRDLVESSFVSVHIPFHCNTCNLTTILTHHKIFQLAKLLRKKKKPLK